MLTKRYNDNQVGNGHGNWSEIYLEPMPTREDSHSQGAMPIANGKVVTITYSLSTNGVVRYVRSSMWGDRPLEYLHGAGNIIPGLEKALEGKRPGDRFTVHIPPSEAYGERDRNLQQKLPAAIFGGVNRVEAGMRFVAQGEEGKPAEVLMITDVDEEEQSVLVDANHPLAGLTLEMDVKIHAVRDASVEELEQGFVTPPGTP